ncbi:MAG: hypothetical protein HQ536_01130 [Parcubacteria group bacterium]|nr:hypothetical protein [Parcubacteria group bacterium]
MTKYNCEHKNSPDKQHKWKFHTAAEWKIDGPKPTYLICEHCGKLIIASELMQINAIKNQTTTTLILVITTIIAFAALIVSIISISIKP